MNAQEFVFTGTSIMGINPDSGKFKSHTDTWDSIQNQEFLSSEAVKDLIAQILQVHRYVGRTAGWSVEVTQPRHSLIVWVGGGGTAL
jgi:hypothetical protein